MLDAEWPRYPKSPPHVRVLDRVHTPVCRISLIYFRLVTARNVRDFRLQQENLNGAVCSTTTQAFRLL